jgi:predicted DNA-binding transcriptional regulator AlpA
MQSNQEVSQKGFSVREASIYTGISVSTLNKWRMHTNNGPKYSKLGSRVIYPKDQLDAWMAQNLKSSTSQYEQAGWEA